MKLIIAPHVIDENHLVEIIGKLKRPYVRYTRADERNVLKADCLIIDCFGLLYSRNKSSSGPHELPAIKVKELVPLNFSTNGSSLASSTKGMY